MSKPSSESVDFLVIGGGIAGLTFALEAQHHGSVAVLFKRSGKDSSTSWAQGGIAAVEADDDDHSLHAQDTLETGGGICDPKIVDIVVREGPELVKALEARGAKFDRHNGGEQYDLHREGGHSRRRIFHAGDSTGWEIQRALLEAVRAAPNIRLLEDTCAVDIITTRKFGLAKGEPNSAVGAYVLFPDGEVRPIAAKKILMATGGAGKIYLYTSNPDVATGDGIAMCFRAGAAVANMEFFQFHPTCLYHPEAKSFLITEAMRGEGAKLRRIDGSPFMKKYDPREELAPRDIVARAIDHEMKSTGQEHVLLDITHKPADFIKHHFPMIYERCLGLGIDITKQPIPVVPAAHYCCGGVVSDENGRTSIANLYAAGECTYTGLHGANRLASNSLLEGLVFGFRAAKDAIRSLGTEKAKPITIPAWERGSATISSEEVFISHTWDELRRVMWNYVGIVRSDKRLEMALRRADLIAKEIDEYYWDYVVTRDLLELRNIALVSQLVIHSAILRKESRGLHFTEDYPNLDDDFKGPTVIDAGSWYHFEGAARGSLSKKTRTKMSS